MSGSVSMLDLCCAQVDRGWGIYVVVLERLLHGSLSPQSLMLEATVFGGMDLQVLKGADWSTTVNKDWGATKLSRSGVVNDDKTYRGQRVPRRMKHGKGRGCIRSLSAG